MDMKDDPCSRRGFLMAGGLIAGAQLVGTSASAQEEAAEEAKPFSNPVAYKFMIGDIEAWSISDGYFAPRQGVTLMYPESERPAMIESLKKEGEPLDRLPLYVNILVIRKGKDVIVFDAGFGAPDMSWKGWFLRGLADIGIRPEDVTACFLSHGHTDHIAGFLHEGKPTFPNAPIYATKAEFDFWTSENPDFSMSRRNPERIPKMVKTIRQHFLDLKPVMKLIEPGAEFFNGMVKVEDGSGHTPGHAFFRIRSGDEELVHIADVAHHHVLMFDKPEWVLAWDHNPVKALATRAKVFKELSEKHSRVYGFHLAFPGLGRVVATGAGHRWAPERYEWK